MKYRTAPPGFAIAFLVFSLPIWGQAQQQTLCSALVATYVNQLTFLVPVSQTARVEVRRCGERATETLQLVAWEAQASTPALIVDTTDFTIVQAASRQNIYIIETTGGPRDRVYVILYEAAKPVVKLMRVTKGTAKITMGRDIVDIVIPDIYAGDSPPRTENYTYHLR